MHINPLNWEIALKNSSAPGIERDVDTSMLGGSCGRAGERGQGAKTAGVSRGPRGHHVAACSQNLHSLDTIHIHAQNERHCMFFAVYCSEEKVAMSLSCYHLSARFL